MSNYHHFQGRYNNNRDQRTVYVDVPLKACGLIVGKGGRNIKELQQLNGIQHIRVDFDRGTVKISGNEDGIIAAKHRINQAVVLAVNSDGYFPDTTLTCMLFPNYSAIRFQQTSQLREYVVNIEKLDANRQYFLFDSTIDEVDLVNRMNTLTLAKEDKPVNKSDIVAGFDASKYMPYFDEVIRTYVEELSASVFASISINFGKTFVSSVPEANQGRTLSMKEVTGIGYGRRGLRPEFVSNFNIDKRDAFLNSTKGEYEELSSGNYIVVHCVSQKTKKRYKIKLRIKEDKGTVIQSSHVIKKIATAATYYSVLEVQPTATLRSIKIAFRRKALQVHPDKNTDASAEKAMKVVNEAWECLKDETGRAAYGRLSLSKQRPQNNFKYCPAVDAEPFPEIESFQSVGRKLGLCTVLKEAARCEFRTTIETAKDEAVDHTMIRKLQDAWDARSDNDGKLRFPNGTDDWLIVETIRYKKSVSLTNGTFILTIDEAAEDHFSKSCSGVHISLQSYDIQDTLKLLPVSSDIDGTVSRLVSYVRDIQQEGTKISSLIDVA